MIAPKLWTVLKCNKCTSYFTVSNNRLCRLLREALFRSITALRLRKRCKFVALLLLPPLRNRASTKNLLSSFLSPGQTCVVLFHLFYVLSSQSLRPVPTIKSPHPDLNVAYFYVQHARACISLYVFAQQRGTTSIG